MKKAFLVLAGALGALVALLFLVIYPPIKATHPALQNAALPELVPLNAFYADAFEKWRFQLSPDGKRMAWLEAKRLKPALWVRDLNDADADIYHSPDEVRWYTWSADSRYLLYSADRDGWENDQIVSIDVTKPGSAPRTYDFGRDVKAWIEDVPAEAGADILIAHNGRDWAKFDLFRLNLDTGETAPLDVISERAVGWGFDRSGAPYVRSVQSEGSKWSVMLKFEAQWHEVASGGLDENFWVMNAPDADGLYHAITDIGRDKRVLVRKDIATGAEEVLYESDTVDLSWLINHPVSGVPIMAVSYPGLQERHVFDPAIKDILTRLDHPADASLHLVSATADFSKAIWEVEDDRLGWSKFLTDMQTGEIVPFDMPAIGKWQDALSPMEPVSFPASDGLTLHAYLTRPKGVTGPVPTVVRIHGGPVVRVPMAGKSRLCGFDGQLSRRRWVWARLPRGRHGRGQPQNASGHCRCPRMGGCRGHCRPFQGCRHGRQLWRPENPDSHDRKPGPFCGRHQHQRHQRPVNDVKRSARLLDGLAGLVSQIHRRPDRP